jgi:hypothetical protein
MKQVPIRNSPDCLAFRAVLVLFHHLFHALFDLFRSSFAISPVIDAGSDAGDHTDKIIDQIIMAIGGEDGFHVASLRVEQCDNVVPPKASSSSSLRNFGRISLRPEAISVTSLATV